MSMKGSLMPYENNNDVNKSRLKTPPTNKTKPQIQPQPPPPPPKKSKCFRAHFNSLWSVWYGLCATGLQSYIALQCAKRFLGFAALPWPNDTPPPKFELHAYLVLSGTAVLLLPFFLTAAIFKIGNLANDGFKLGKHLSTCTADPPSVLLGAGSGLGSQSSGVFKSLWQHGGPTAPFLHLATAFCLLLPKLLMEARLIQADILPKDNIWRTDLDFLVVHHERFFVLNFMTSTPPSSNSTIPFLPTPLPYMTSSSASTNVSESFATLVASALNASSDATTAEHLEAPHSSPLRRLHDLISPDMESTEWGPISAEFLNYALALLVYAVRYPAVFWNTNKGFGTLFSFQLLANGIQSLLAYAGICVLYKVQVVGVWESLPHRAIKSPIIDTSPLLLNAHLSLALFVLSNILVLASSLVLYLYGYGRFNAFLNAERSRRVIVLRDGRAGGNWGYFTHCAALCVLLSIAVCNAPLLYDCTVLYRNSLDGAILASVVGAIMHLFLWVLLWLVLTIKRRWVFKLRVTVGRAAVRSARSVKLVTEVDLAAARHNADDSAAPLLVVGNGRTYTVADTSPKKAIMSVIQKAAIDRKARAGQGDKSVDEGEEQIYWLRPKPPSPAKTSPDSTSDRLTWLNRKLSPSPSGAKPKVTFDESAKKGKSPKSCKGRMKGQPRGMDRPMSESEDDGDYATLREIPLMSSIAEPSDDSVSEDNKLLDCALRDDSVTYARTNRDLNPRDYEDPSPLLTPEPPESPPRAPVMVTVHSVSDEDSSSLQAPVTPQCLRRADSGMPHDELPPRSGSVSTESSGGSPPCGGNHSETSSGVSSGREPEPRRATSVDDLALEADSRVAPPWRSFSLQRNVMPPTSSPIQAIYGFHSATNILVPGRPAVLLESTEESTVVIRRKQLRPKTTEGVVVPPPIKEEPFGRSTNMRMTSFTDNPDGSRPAECYQASSSTLPHYPTQPSVQYPHCSTMPLPNCVPPPIIVNNTAASCHSFPRHHTTIPTHHNGVRLFGGPNPFVKRFPSIHHQVGNGRLPQGMVAAPNYVNAEMAHNSHHSFPHLMAQVKYNVNNQRDSANFSMASSGDSDQYLPNAGHS